MIAMLLGLTIAFMSISIFIRRYNHSILPGTQELVHTNEAGYTTLIATGTIQEKQTHNRYLRKADNGTTFFLYSDTQYQPGDYIRLTANAQPSATQHLSLFTNYNDKKDRFLDYWREYRFDFQKRQIMK